MPFPAFLKKGKKSKEGTAAEEAGESPAEEAAEQKAGKGDNPFAKKKAFRGGGTVSRSWKTQDKPRGGKSIPAVKALKAGGMVVRGAGAAVRGKGTKGVI
jgi:hypothetical protein